MNLKHGLLAICTAFISMCGAANAAEIKFTFNSEGNKIGLLSGEIKPGDTQKVATFYATFPSIQLLHLHSRGGDVIEAIRLGELVRTLRIQVAVQDQGICASACFFVWLNGAYRVAVGKDYREGSGPIGLHRPYLANPENQESSLQRQAAVISGVRNYLDNSFVPRRLIDTMMSRPSTDVYWLTEDDLEELGPVPAPLQELYISKCSENTHQLSRQIGNAKRSGDSQEQERLTLRLRKAFRCSAELDMDAHEAAIKKLKTGWLPALPFTVAK